MNDSKNKLISDTYYDLAGFNNIKEHFKSVKEKDKTITLENVKQWRNKNIEAKANLKGYNSWIPSKAKEEYQMDLAFFDMNDKTYKGALFMIDPFTKFAAAEPFKTKQPNDVLDCIKECFIKMGGKPETIYSDFEGSFNSKEIQQYFKDNDIRWLYTNTHAAYVERLIRTIKNYIFKRAEHHGGEWYKYLWASLLVYNNKTVHSVLGMTPSEATRKSNEFNVRLKLMLNKKHKRNYPEVKMGDTVKVYKKKDLKHKKERFSVWSSNRYTVEKINEDDYGQRFYKLSGLPKQYLRHEILKI